MRFVVIQFSSYLTEFRKYLLTTRYGVVLRNLIYVKPDRKLYFLDNGQNEHCLSHPAWSNVTGEPATYPPDTHTHDWADVTGEPATFPPTTHTHDWGDVTGEPATFPPTTHTHDWGDVTGEPATFPPEAHTHDWADVTGEPATYPPDTHTHNYADPAHTHNYADPAHTHNYADPAHTHNYADPAHTHNYADPAHTHQRIVGEMIIWPTDTPPSQWLLCYGQAVSRTTYSGLFAVIGTTYGTGNGSTTFNIPDLRGRVVLGQDDMGGSSANRVTSPQADNLGWNAGAETVTLITNELPAHTHTQDSHNHTQNSHNHTQDAHSHSYPAYDGIAGSGTAPVQAAAGTPDTDNTYTTTATNQAATATNQNTGGGWAHNNMPPYITLNFIIFAGA